MKRRQKESGGMNASGLIYDDEGNDITMDVLADPAGQDRMPRAHYPGDVRECDYIAGRRLDGVPMRAVEGSYDEQEDRTTVTFLPDHDRMWQAALEQEDWARHNMHAMYPVFFPVPR